MPPAEPFLKLVRAHFISFSVIGVDSGGEVSQTKASKLKGAGGCNFFNSDSVVLFIGAIESVEHKRLTAPVTSPSKSLLSAARDTLKVLDDDFFLMFLELKTFISKLRKEFAFVLTYVVVLTRKFCDEFGSDVEGVCRTK